MLILCSHIPVLVEIHNFREYWERESFMYVPSLSWDTVQTAFITLKKNILFLSDLLLLNTLDIYCSLLLLLFKKVII